MWFVYMIQCENGSLYTGVTTDLARRTKEHVRGVGAKYTKAHRAVRLVFSEVHETRSRACVREAEIKKLSHKEKRSLFEGS